MKFFIKNSSVNVTKSVVSSRNCFKYVHQHYSRKPQVLENVPSGSIVPKFGEFYYTHGNYNTKESFDIININNFSQARPIFSNVAPIYRTLIILFFSISIPFLLVPLQSFFLRWDTYFFLRFVFIEFSAEIDAVVATGFDGLTLVSFCLLLVVILGGGVVTNDDEFRMNFISTFAFDFVSVDADDACCHFSYRCCSNLKSGRRNFQ